MIWSESTYAVSNETRKGEIEVEARIVGDSTLLVTIQMEAGPYPNTHSNEIRISHRDIDISDRTILDELCEGFEKARSELHKREGAKNAG